MVSEEIDTLFDKLVELDNNLKLAREIMWEAFELNGDPREDFLKEHYEFLNKYYYTTEGVQEKRTIKKKLKELL